MSTLAGNSLVAPAAGTLNLVMSAAKGLSHPIGHYSLHDNSYQLLWTFEADAWVPHGVDDGEGMQQAKAWISTDPEKNRIEAPFLFLTHGVMPASWDGLERAFILFDGRSEAQVQQAREQWKLVSAQDNVTASYFAQDDDGRWQKKA